MPSSMAMATCLPLMGLPKVSFAGLALGLVGLFVDAAVGAVDGFSLVVLEGEFCWGLHAYRNLALIRAPSW